MPPYSTIDAVLHQDILLSSVHAETLQVILPTHLSIELQVVYHAGV